MLLLHILSEAAPASESSRPSVRALASGGGSIALGKWYCGKVARAAAVVALFGVFSRILGFVREIVLAGVYGATAQTDAYVNALFVVNTGAAVLLYVLTTLMIPVFQQERERNGADSAWSLLWAIFAWVGIVLIAVTAVIAIWPEGPIALFNMGPERAAIASDLLRVMAPALMLQGFSALFTAILQVHGRFAGPAAVGIAFNAGILIGVVAGAGTLGITAAAWGVTLGAVLQVALGILEREAEAARQRKLAQNARRAREKMEAQASASGLPAAQTLRADASASASASASADAGAGIGDGDVVVLEDIGAGVGPAGWDAGVV
jgi:putative peptidoglycan lipid II flippase